MKLVSTQSLSSPEVNGDTPTLRLVSLLEVIASKDQLISLHDLAEDTELPKATLHRMLAQLEAAGLLQRSGDGRRYRPAARLRRLAHSLLLNDLHHGAQHAVLRRLVDTLGESCNLTTLSGHEVVYLDRVETAAPLRFFLQAGSRVPVHCSASGKLFLSQMTAVQRRRLLAHAPLQAYTPRTLTDLAALEREILLVKKLGYAIDHEEFLPGLMCVAVLVPGHGQQARSHLCLAIQAPTVRLTPDKALKMLAPLQAAAASLSRIEADAARPDSEHNGSEHNGSEHNA